MISHEVIKGWPGWVGSGAGIWPGQVTFRSPFAKPAATSWIPRLTACFYWKVLMRIDLPGFGGVHPLGHSATHLIDSLAPRLGSPRLVAGSSERRPAQHAASCWARPCHKADRLEADQTCAGRVGVTAFARPSRVRSTRSRPTEASRMKSFVVRAQLLQTQNAPAMFCRSRALATMVVRCRHSLAGTKFMVFSSLLRACEFRACAAMASSALTFGKAAANARFAT